MPLATKNGAIIVKDGKLAENCGCCGEWYCCMDSKCVSDAIKSVSATISASDWSYQQTLSSSCGTKYASAYFKGSSASGTKALTYDGSTAWTAIATGCDCYVAIRYVPYYVRYQVLEAYGNQITLREVVARLEVRAVAKSSSNDATLKKSDDIPCGAMPSFTETLYPNAAVADELHPSCIDKLSPLTAVYTIGRPQTTVSSDCSGISFSPSESGSNVVTVTITPSYS
jgi:hypothetical protein